VHRFGENEAKLALNELQTRVEASQKIREKADITHSQTELKISSCTRENPISESQKCVKATTEPLKTSNKKPSKSNNISKKLYNFKGLALPHIIHEHGWTSSTSSSSMSDEKCRSGGRGSRGRGRCALTRSDNRFDSSDEDSSDEDSDNDGFRCMFESGGRAGRGIRDFVLNNPQHFQLFNSTQGRGVRMNDSGAVILGTMGRGTHHDSQASRATARKLGARKPNRFGQHNGLQIR